MAQSNNGIHPTPRQPAPHVSCVGARVMPGLERMNSNADKINVMEHPEAYPMPSFPTLEVRDLAASTRWYRDVLGFVLVFEMPDAIAHLRWMKYADLLLVPGRGPASEKKGLGVTLTFNMFDGGVDSLFEEAKARGANVIGVPTTQPWNARDVTILDPDGYRLKFSQRASEDKSFDEVISGMMKGAERG